MSSEADGIQQVSFVEIIAKGGGGDKAIYKLQITIFQKSGKRRIVLIAVAVAAIVDRGFERGLQFAIY